MDVNNELKCGQYEQCMYNKIQVIIDLLIYLWILQDITGYVFKKFKWQSIFLIIISTAIKTTYHCVLYKLFVENLT